MDKVNNKFVYVDNAATTKIFPQVLNAMMPYLTEGYGNPSSIYSVGREAKKAIEQSRERVAAAIGASPTEIFFTSGGSESDNWGIRGTVSRQAVKGKRHIITSVFEHHAVLHTCQHLEKQGYKVTYLPVDDKGLLKAEQVADAICDDTALVTIMYANNEIGTIQPIPEIAKICRERGVLFHTDAVQAIGNVKINVKDMNIDLLSLSGHKIHCAKGIGALYVRRGVLLDNFIYGGAQERGRRAGTENVASIVGLAEAITIANTGISERVEVITKMRNRLIDGILTIPKTRLNGDRDKRLCGNANVSIEAIEGESLLLMLDMNGICGSSGSACTSGSLDPSHVLLALGLPHAIAHGSLRLSLSQDTTNDDIDYILKILPKIVDRLREMSPIWNG